MLLQDLGNRIMPDFVVHKGARSSPFQSSDPPRLHFILDTQSVQYVEI